MINDPKILERLEIQSIGTGESVLLFNLNWGYHLELYYGEPRKCIELQLGLTEDDIINRLKGTKAIISLKSYEDNRTLKKDKQTGRYLDSITATLLEIKPSEGVNK